MKPYLFGWNNEDYAHPETGQLIIKKGSFWFTTMWFWHYRSAKNIKACTIRILGINVYFSEPNAMDKLINKMKLKNA